MLQIKKILFPTDYSACAEHAFSQAAYLAGQYDAALHVLHVAEPLLVLPPLGLSDADVAADLHLPPPAAPVPEAHRAGERILRNVEVPPIDGSVERAILAYAAQEAIDVIVMGTHGRRALDRLLLGSVASKVIRLAECPVFTVGFDAGSWQHGEARRILAPVDFSDHAQVAVAYAKDLAAIYGAHLDLLHVVEETTLAAVYGMEPVAVRIPEVEDQAREALAQLVNDVGGPETPFTIHVLVGHPAYEIVDFAERQGTGLIVIATHGLTGIKRLLLGSVAERVVHRASCPVFTVKGFGQRLSVSAAQTDALETPLS